MSPLRRVVLLLTTHMLLMSLCECDPPTTVHITDCLSNKQWLNFHCKSKNDDLGSRVLAPTNSYKFSFQPDVWATTLFYCSMYWQGDKKLHWFNIFEAQRDITCTDCFWSIKDTGPCRSLTQPNCSAGDKYVKCYNWNPSEWAATIILQICMMPFLVQNKE